MTKQVDFERKGAEEIGKLFVAFGSIEIITHKCLKAFSVGRPAATHVSKMQLAARIEAIVDLVSEKDLVEPNKQEFINNLQRVKGLLETPTAVIPDSFENHNDSEVNFTDLLAASKNAEVLVSGLYANMAVFRNEGINA